MLDLAWKIGGLGSIRMGGVSLCLWGFRRAELHTAIDREKERKKERQNAENQNSRCRFQDCEFSSLFCTFLYFFFVAFANCFVIEWC